jgi:hypothetical protein
MQGLTEMRNLYLPNGEWVGQFIDEATAKAWAKSKGYKVSECEISTRKVVRAARDGQYPSPSDSGYEIITDLEGDKIYGGGFPVDESNPEAVSDSFYEEDLDSLDEDGSLPDDLSDDAHYQQFTEVVEPGSTKDASKD